MVVVMEVMSSSVRDYGHRRVVAKHHGCPRGCLVEDAGVAVGRTLVQAGVHEPSGTDLAGTRGAAGPVLGMVHGAELHLPGGLQEHRGRVGRIVWPTALMEQAIGSLNFSGPKKGLPYLLGPYKKFTLVIQYMLTKHLA